ncbi:MAG: helix-turn-helix domain-containing protein [Dehalococcoidia bacterium]|nr:helix-turn-helix domain-containing protein [Dehalococcoidia bacterium]
MIINAEQVQVGERVRSLRTALGMSVRTLAARAGFSPSFISQMENGLVSPSIASLERIASILGVTLAGFFTAERPDTSVITRASDRRELSSSWSQARIEVLASSGTSRQLEAVMITVSPGGRSGKRPSSHSGEEFALVFDGEIVLNLGADVHILRRGDTASFSSEVLHLWENPGPAASQIVIVSSRFIH